MTRPAFGINPNNLADHHNRTRRTLTRWACRLLLLTTATYALGLLINHIEGITL